MRVSHYFEWERWITGGHAQSVRNQRTIMDRNGIEYTTSPDLSADLLHLNNMGPRSLYYAKRARRAGVPVLVHAHQTAEDFRESFALSNVLARPMRPYLEYAYPHADHLVCVSEFNADEMDRYAPEVPKTVISNGFDPETVAGHDDPDLRETYLERYDLDPPVVFMVGHVIKRKGLETFVETARAMPELDFAWFGPINRSLKGRPTKRLIDSAPENCTFTGYVDDIRGAYGAGDIFFFPTHEENEGIALLEAMSAGKPVLVRDIETFSWLEDGEDCLKSTGSFEEPLETLKDPGPRRRLGANAMRRSEAFSLASVANRYESLYERVT
jgi:glycosyltransferase involved in cell wall biosynthesis